MAARNAVCPSCSHQFDLSGEQLNLIAVQLQRGAQLAMIKCPKCWTSFGLDLGSGDSVEEAPEIFRCPVSRCTGIVGCVDGRQSESGSTWACSYCGSYWDNKDSLFGDIATIIKKYRYREQFYRATAKGFEPTEADLTELVRAQVINEEDDDALGYERS